MSERARAADLAALSEEVSRLKRATAPTQAAVPAPAKKTQPDPPRVAGRLPPLRQSVSGNVQAQKTIEFRYNDATPLEGVIAHLTRECGGNVHEKGVVEVTGSSSFLGYGHARFAADLGTGSSFISSDEPNSWIRYDFKERRLAPTSYSIRAGNGSFPSSWVLEVSNDGIEGSWEVVGRRENNHDLKGKGVTWNFAITAPPRGGFRFVRLRQTGKNHGGTDCLCVNSLELFGTLSPQ